MNAQNALAGNVTEGIAAVAQALTVAEAVKQLAKLQVKIKQMEALEKNYQDIVKAAMGDTENMEIAGHIVSYTKMTSKRLNQSKFKAEQLSLYEQYIEEVESRRFSVK